MTRPGGPCVSNEVSTHARLADSNHAWHIVVAAEVRGARWHCANSGSTFGVSQKGTDFHGGETGDPRDGHDAIGVPAAHNFLPPFCTAGGWTPRRHHCAQPSEHIQTTEIISSSSVIIDGPELQQIFLTDPYVLFSDVSPCINTVSFERESKPKPPVIELVASSK